MPKVCKYIVQRDGRHSWAIARCSNLKKVEDDGAVPDYRQFQWMSSLSHVARCLVDLYLAEQPQIKVDVHTLVAAADMTRDAIAQIAKDIQSMVDVDQIKGEERSDVEVS